MEISVPQNAAALNTFLQRLDKVLMDAAIEWARKCYEAILEELDGLIAEHRDRKLTIEHGRGVWYQTCLGPVRVKRRQYRDNGGCYPGRYRYLLDELAGMGRYRHVTGAVQERVLEMATVMPYRRSAEVLRKLFDSLPSTDAPVPPTTTTRSRIASASQRPRPKAAIRAVSRTVIKIPW